jgi:hypothetical protein
MNQKNFRFQCLERISSLMILALITGSFFCCSKDDPDPLNSEGMLTGTVYMYDYTDPSNTRITAHGPYGDPSTVANADGSYELKGLGNATYEVEFFKEGYGKMIKYGVKVYGNDTVHLDAWALYKMADFRMPKLTTVLYPSTSPFLYDYEVGIETDIPEDNAEQMQIRVFVSDRKDVSNKNYLHSDMAYAYIRENSTQVMIFEPNPQIVNGDGSRLFASGQSLYVIAYVCSLQEETAQFSEYYGVPLYTTAYENQHSQVIEIIAP